MSSTPLIGHMTYSLDTGQTEDDAFNPKPIYPDLDDSKQLTGKPIQPYLSLVGQLQWLVTLGRLVIHGRPTTLSRFKSTPRQLQRIYGYVRKTIDFYWIQSKQYLNEILSNHWDLNKILPMITNLLLTCGPTTLFPRSAFMETPKLYYYMGYLPHHTQVSIIYTHTHTIILHIPTYYTCQHKSMPQFGILHTSGCLTVDVPCLHHLWDSQKDCPGKKQIIWSMCKIPGNMPLCMPLGPLWQSCHAWITYKSICRVVVNDKQHCTCYNLSCMTRACMMDGHA